ncbi:MAG: hypothetical protein IH891_06320, partial [Planctomycetes bacterium]|nr:hypothetical protein [Planctomycetota bacterium]
MMLASIEDAQALWAWQYYSEKKGMIWVLGKNMKPKKSVLIGYGIICLLVATFNASAQSVIFVDDSAADGGDGSSWALAYNNLQTALNVSFSGDTLHVAQGLYIAPKDGVVGLLVDGFVLTDGDREIFQLIYEYRFLRRDQISTLTDRPTK